MPKDKVKVINTSQEKPLMRPALSPEARENQLIALAMDLVEERLRNGTASSQETTHFLKLASLKEKLEQEILTKQKDLLDAKTSALKSQAGIERMYAEAIRAMKVYSGQEDKANEQDEEY